MKNKISVQWVVVASLVCIYLFASGGAVSARERSEIRVGAHVSMTGMNAMTGAEEKWAYETAVADINARGGVYVKELDKKLPIRLILMDDKSVADQGAAAMERLIKLENIDFALNGNVTPISIAAATVCEKYHVLMLHVCTWLDFLEKEKFNYSAGMFTSTTEAARTPFLIWESLDAAKRPKHPALMVEDNRDGQAFGDGFRHLAKEYGVEFVVDDPYTPGSKDFSSYILKFKAAKVDALLWLGSPTDGITLLRQMKEAQLHIPYIHGYKGFWPTEFVNAMGEDANYIIHDGFWSEKNGEPGSAELGQRYREAFGHDAVSLGLYYASPQVLAMAIERAGSLDSTKVRDAVFNGEFDGTVMGDIKYDDKGLAFKPLIALQWWHKERIPIYPPVPGVSVFRMPGDQ
ncbi:MAG: amino acid ABC transporter substrate-binding protein [Desulfopila sp.]